MDKLTQDFFETKFPGFNDQVIIADNVFQTSVPVVELEYNLNVDLLLKYCLDIKVNEIGNRQGKTQGYQKEPRWKGWHCYSSLWNYGYQSTHMLDIYNKKLDAPPPIKYPDEKTLKIRKYFLDLGLDFRLLLNMILNPNSYLRPHRDISFDPNPLLYCWIPLTNPKGSELKFYPYGTVDVKLGNVYLFNQENFVHAIRNTNKDLQRYSMIGYLDSKTILPKFKQQVTDAIQKQYLTF